MLRSRNHELPFGFAVTQTEPDWRDRLHEVMFEAETPAGKAFDIVLLILIAVSIVAVALESVASIAAEHGILLRRVEWGITILFTVEYILRLLCVRQPARYARSTFGIIDLLAILPSYLSLFFAGTQSLAVIRGLRLLRVFRVLKLAQFVGEAQALRAALWESRQKIIVFVGFVLTTVCIIGSAMYLVEGPENGFTSIPLSIYWAVVTMTTVGYGDLAPHTVVGKLLATIVMIMGYGIIAIPTGIVGVEIVASRRGADTRSCQECGGEDHARDAKYCKHCGSFLE